MPSPQQPRGALAEALRQAGRTVSFEERNVLFVERDQPERVFLIDDGWVLLSCTGENGRQIVLGLAGPGDVLGEVSIFDEGSRSATATALTPVRATVAPIAALRAAANEVPLAHELIAMLIARLRTADRQRIELATVATHARVARRLVELCERFGVSNSDGVQVALPLSQEQLANWCGASREATVKALATLRALGVISTARRNLLIRDLDALRRHASGRA